MLKAKTWDIRERTFEYSLQAIEVLRRIQTLHDEGARIIGKQFLRSATSIGANIVEGGNSTSKREFINYFNIALKSSAETLYWLEMLKELRGDKEKEIETLINECAEINKLISTIILNTKNNSRF